MNPLNRMNRIGSVTNLYLQLGQFWESMRFYPLFPQNHAVQSKTMRFKALVMRFSAVRMRFRHRGV
jgi:hypothetical protein